MKIQQAKAELLELKKKIEKGTCELMEVTLTRSKIEKEKQSLEKESKEIKQKLFELQQKRSMAESKIEGLRVQNDELEELVNEMEQNVY